MTTPLPKRPTERGEIDREAIVTQLERILEHPAFRGSARSARFLRYVVEYWLEEDHHGELLKERTLGVALFHLDPAYDTTQNTIVRNAAVDVRKRLLAYYLEPEHAEEIQIALPVGSYIPQISFPSQTHHETETPAEEPRTEYREASRTPAGLLSEVQEPLLKRFRWRRSIFLFAAVLVVLAGGALCGILAWRHWDSPLIGTKDLSTLNLFWKPVLNAAPPEPIILICVGQSSQVVNGQQVMPIGNALALADITRLFALYGEKFRIAVANSVTAQQLQASTAVLIGGMDNPWTTFVTEPLRYSLSSQTNAASQKIMWIEDRKNPDKKNWFTPAPSPVSGEVNDYAIVARFKDPKTGQWRVVIGGLNDVGTSAVSRILVVPSSLREMTKHLPAGWESRNIEVVFRIRIIDGRVGYPQFMAYDIW